MTASSQELTWLYNSVLELVEELEPDEFDYFEMNGREVVAALMAGEDVRKTFNRQRVSGDAGAGPLQLASEVIACLRLASSTYKTYKAIRGYLAPPAPPPSSLLEGIIQELVADGYSFEEARRIATKAVAVIRKHAGE